MCIAIAATFAACKKKKQSEAATTHPAVSVVPIETIPDFIETHGLIGDGSSINVMQLIEEDGDTLELIISDQIVMGGLIVGDEAYAIYNIIDESPVAQSAINLTALQHLWSQNTDEGTKSLEIDSRGRATTYNMSIQYDHWTVQDGVLLLSSPRKVGDEKPADVDTFQIMMLTEDSLVLMANSAAMATAFYRDN